ncbi:PAS domain S-box protein [Ulvibacter antarcticus]|uniref:PAS domain S-box protein n=1 Tax=Ulvibacter antarcticus TaxID=442714 RepID=UPI0011C3BFC1|nr:PAS domain S-box protein [Ulvibacter antarcticus]
MQKQDAYLINKSGKQRALSQNITKIVFSIDNDSSDTLRLNSLKTVIDEFESTHNYLINTNKEGENNSTIDSLLKTSELQLKKIVSSSRNIINDPDSEFLIKDVNTIAKVEPFFLLTMDALVNEYQKNAEKNLQNLKLIIYFLVLIAVLILIGELLFVLTPGLKQLFQRNKELREATTELAISENKLNLNALELKKLKKYLEAKDEHNKIFIEQSPIAIAMVDNNMRYIAVSKRWITDYKMEGKEFIGRSHYDLFPEIGEEWKKMHQRCLNGAIDINDEEPFIRTDGSLQWITWDVRPWYDSDGNIGGILMQTGDITKRKKTENELLRKNQLLTFAEKITMMGNWQWDLTTNAVKWSANLFQIFGLDENSDVSYDTYFSFVHPDDKEMVTEHVQKSLEDKKFDDLSHRIKLKDGTVKIIQLLAEIITNKDGELIEMIGTCQDVTEQRMAENKFRGLLESAPDAMVIVNEKGHIQLINKQAEILFGYSALELIEKSVEILIPKRFTGNHEKYRDSFFTNPKVRGMGVGKELFGINKEGIEIPIQISLSPLQTEEGLLVSAAIRDITEQKLAEHKILQAKESLEVLTQHLTDQNNQLADFAHITSHNLRSPVSNLNALLHLYNISDSEEERKLLFEKFEIVISHLTSTLNTLIEALKTKKGVAKEIEFIDFEEILSITKEIISGQIIKSNATITSEFSRIPKIKYHKTYLESIFLNLVTNAVKYRSPDRNPEIHIETEYINDKIKLTFRDNGLGIDLKKHGHKLFGLNKTFHRHPEAKGVGLYLTKIQIESMGGIISAASEVNKGSVFTIIFNEDRNEKPL